jgi:FkbM family methyltransferase
LTRVTLDIAGIGRPVSLSVHSGDDLVSKEIAVQRVWEPYETELLLSRLGSGQTFVDVGANIGYYSVIADQVVGTAGSIYAFEPEQKNFELLARNMNNCTCRDVHLHQAGLSDVTGVNQLYLSPDNWGDHRISPGEGREKQSVAMLCGDDLLAGRRIDFLKIDTQGAEYQVVKGLKHSILKNSGWLTVIVEFWPWGLAASGSSAEALVELIQSFGMPLYIVDHQAHRLIPAAPEDLLAFAQQARAAKVPQGFINLMLGGDSRKSASRPD